MVKPNRDNAASSHLHPEPQKICPSAFKAKQAAKIRELRKALVAQGYVSLEQQADALGLSRSTTWAILKADHKASGLQATVISRILNSRRLPSEAERVLKEYIEEKASGMYGHSKEQTHQFCLKLSRSGATEFNQ